MDMHKVYTGIKFISHDRMMAVFQNTPGPLEYKHENGVLSMVQVEVVGMGKKNVRVVNLPPRNPKQNPTRSTV
jgi:hypothetical protein